MDYTAIELIEAYNLVSRASRKHVSSDMRNEFVFVRY